MNQNANSHSIRTRFESLKTFGESLAKDLENKVRTQTGIPNFKVFVHDQFEASFPEDHLTRDGRVMLSLRLSLDLKGFGEARVRRVKDLLEARVSDWQLLRPNFEDSREEIDFDWHLTEKERDDNQGLGFGERILGDSQILSDELRRLIQLGDPGHN